MTDVSQSDARRRLSQSETTFRERVEALGRITEAELLSAAADYARKRERVEAASEVLRSLTRSIEEEAEPIRKLIADEDSDCISRDLRAARLEGLEFALRVIRLAEIWEW